ncbi:MAG: phytoene/squalene synthase family protein [Deltaproteobacteria bacterium]
MNALALTTTGEDIVSVDRGRREARRRTRVGSRSFYFASFALPAERRDAAYALYAFFRGADDAADAPASSEERAVRLREVRASLERAYRGEAITDVEHAVGWAVRRFGVPRRPLEELLDAVEGDVGRVRMADMPMLEKYCHGVASTVGLAMAPLLGAPDHALDGAARLGRAMQLTNILRDVREDLAMDRIYLPADAMAHHGVTEEALREGRVDPSWRALAGQIAAAAERDYAAAEAGIIAIGPWRSRLTVRLMRASYREILRRIVRRDYDVFRERVVVSTARKLWLASGVLVGADAARVAS